MESRRTSNFFTFCCLALILLLIVSVIGFVIWKYVLNQEDTDTTTSAPPEITLVDLKRFTSSEDFSAYLQESAEVGGTTFGVGLKQEMLEDVVALEEGVTTPSEDTSTAQRVSETTVQVRGIDEPDIVKTDGENIFFSQSSYGYYRGLEEDVIVESETESEEVIPKYQNATKVIKAFPPEDLETLSEIAKTGNLLLLEDTLLVFVYDGIYGYDVSDPASAKKLWDLEYGNSSYLIDARLYEDKMYLVTKTSIDNSRPCPIKPLVISEEEVAIQCTDVYHPIVNVPVDTTYSIMVVGAESGEVEQKVSFVGTSDSSIVYMSTNALYITYSYYEDYIEFFYNFFVEKCNDLVPNSVIEDLEKLQEYDISARAKYVEFEVVLEQWLNSLDEDEELEVNNEMENRMDEYYTEHKRELERTGVVKVDIDNLEVSATADVPGRPLNQFSLDEHEGNLRIATTVGWSTFAGSSDESVSDVYILDSGLREKGSVKDLGEGEKIYSVRFIQDKGYVVTFKQIDPFFVLDLSDPSAPELKGELKIPGYSSYLHPITQERILGIGKEGAKVKLSLFDVSDPSDPKEADKYQLDEYWSDVLETHHAFLLDGEHGVFFMPGSKGGYVFSYENDNLKLKKAVSNIQARRAIYIDDYMYIVGEEEIVVLDESDWEVIEEMSFD